MFRIDNPSAIPSLPIVPPVGTPGFFTNGNPQTGLDPTHVDDWFLNMLQEEIYTVVTNAGLVPNKNDNTQLWQALSRVFRLRLTGPTNFYVDPVNGNDINSGTTPQSAWATLSHAAVYLIENIDFNTYKVTVNLAAGTYAPMVMSGCPIGCTQPAQLVFQGYLANPASVIINNPATGDVIHMTTGANATFQGMQIQGAGGNANGALSCLFESVVNYQNVIFGAFPGGAHVAASWGAYIGPIGPYTIAGGAASHFNCSGSGTRFGQGTSTPMAITLTGTPAFSDAFAQCNTLAFLGLNGATVTFSGSATGMRFHVSRCAIIDSWGTGVNYFPGSVAGVADAATFGLYQ